MLSVSFKNTEGLANYTSILSVQPLIVLSCRLYTSEVRNFFYTLKLRGLDEKQDDWEVE